MSWLVELAGKAEDFLNKVDQGAAAALLTTPIENVAPSHTINAEASSSSQYSALNQLGSKSDQQVHSNISYVSSAAGNIKRQKATQLAGASNVSLPSRTFEVTAGAPASSSLSRPSTQFVRPKKIEPNDDQLFDFLNSSEKSLNGRVDNKRETTKPSTPKSHSRTSSLSSVSACTINMKTAEEGIVKEDYADGPDASESSNVSQDDQLESSKEQPLSNTASISFSAKDDSQSLELSNLRLENQLLRSEVSSLNQEMASLIERSKQTQEEFNKARKQIEKWNTENSKSDRIGRELRSQVDDLNEVLSAKDSQLAVLKVRLEEADQLLKARNEALELLHNERNRILQDHSEGSSLHNQALQTVQERLLEVESSLKREQDNYNQMQNEFAARLSKVELERQSLAETLTASERKAIEEKKRADEQQQQLKVVKTSLDLAKQELMDYKQKATRILQSKEKLINSLKEGSGIDGLESHTIITMELEELRHERDMQREEVQKLLGHIQQLRAELQDTETQQLGEAESSREQIQELQEQVNTLMGSKKELEVELERQKQEFQYTEEELHRTKNTLQTRIKDREEEIQKLRNQLTNKVMSSSHTELENRLHQLTETLIQKQTMLEALSTEKNSLVFQLERLEQQLKSVQGSSVNGPAINVSLLENNEGARMRNVPVLFSETDSTTAGMYGKVRKAANTIDRFSIRLGIFLRRYPIARVFVIIYMVLLHLWVMIVLLTYTPEIHHGSSRPDGQ
ncbi:golgin subfamily A member 5 [Carcharodon carcharias]|uniref:golgin subfamily A member 5 n=1 Tax=Carcharodon carcharias TaxID=13397 RepID=UPI001B7EFE29|nr:golgin subfamily A member 5 [Carcharodon carcharias]XP_041070667.1 golgin subfamily A member 5 [Carcharodon carcharias]